MLKKPFAAFWIIVCLTPVFSYAQTAHPTTVGEADARLNELRRSIQELRDAPRVERSSAQDSVIISQDDYATRLERTKKNFKVTAPTQAIADKVCETAAVQWMQSKFAGFTLYAPCNIRVKVGQIGAGGATTFSFSNGQVHGFDMTVQGSLERICDSVVPHEVCHIFNALDTRRPLPRWADEGVATLAEVESERTRQLMLAKEIVGTKRFIPIRELLNITEYPKNMQDVLALYAEGTTLLDFLVSRAAGASGGQWTQEEARQWVIQFIVDAHAWGWDAALYDLGKRDDRPLGAITNVAQLSNEFTKWLKSGGARIYAFKEVVPAGQGLILPVQNNDGNKRVIPAY